MHQRSASGGPMHLSDRMILLISGIGQAFWRKTTLVVGNCMMRGVGCNQSAVDLCSFPGSHLYHIEPNRTPDVSKTVNIL